MSSEALYSVGTWYVNKQAYTPQRGLTVPSFNMNWRQLVVAVRELSCRSGIKEPRLLRSSST